VTQVLFPDADTHLKFYHSKSDIGFFKHKVYHDYQQNKHTELNKHVASMQIDSGNAMDIETASNHVMTSLAENEMWH